MIKVLALMLALAASARAQAPIYATYFGGNGTDDGTAVALDSSDNAYVVGSTTSTNLPGCTGSLTGTQNAFIAKFTSTGSVAWCEYFGGTGTDIANGVTLDSSGNLYVSGQTSSAGLATSGAYQTSLNGPTDAFVAEFNSSGALQWFTYLGGSSYDQANSIALDSSDNIYITGFTESSNYPTAGGVSQTMYGGGPSDAIIAKLNSSGTSLLWSGFVGGNGADVGYAMKVSPDGTRACADGYDQSGNFPATSGAFQTIKNEEYAAWIGCYSTSNGSTSAQTVFGGKSSNSPPCNTCMSSLAFDANGNVWVAGLAQGANVTGFPLTGNALQPAFGGPSHDGFISELNSGLTTLLFGAWYGGKQDDGIVSIAFDRFGNLWSHGNTFSQTGLMTTSGAYQKANGGPTNTSDFFLMSMTAGGSLNYATYFGGSLNEYGGATQGLACDVGCVLVGYSDSTDFPVYNAWQGSLLGSQNVIVVSVSGTGTAPIASFSPTSLSFGNQAVGTSSGAQTATLTNAGTAVLNISNITMGPDYSQTNTCGSAVPAGSNCTFSITFTPTATGAFNESLAISDNAGGSPQSVSLSGTGTAPAVVLSPTSLTFGNQTVGTTSGAQSVTLSNTGSAALSISGVSIGPDYTQTNTCGTSLAVGASCIISVTFTPTSIGALNEFLEIIDNAAGSPQTAVLSGTGVAPLAPAVTLSSSSLTFAVQTLGTTSGPQSVTLTNTGNAVLSIAAIVASGDFALLVTSTSCPYSGGTLNPTLSCTIDVTFTPTAPGPRTGSVATTDNAPGSPQTLSLTGTGTTGATSPVPQINQPAVPVSAAPGTSALTITINGSGFVPGAAVNWNGTPLPTTLVTGEQVTATIPATNLAAAGTASLTVVNPPLGGGASNVMFFPVTSPTPSVFLSRLDLATGNCPQWVGTGDFNGDGKLDVAVVNTVDDTLSILLGNGDGTFTVSPPLAVGAGPVSAAIGDLNGDGILDLAVANSSGNTIFVLLGNGDGTFTAGATLATGNEPLAVALGDLNGDGAQDIAVVNSLDNTVSILLGNGDGTFNAAANPVAVGDQPVSLIAADLNGDGVLDLATANNGDGTISIAFGNGDGTFTLQPTVNLAPGLGSMVAADLNGDGALDLAVADTARNSISILAGGGDGTFTVAASVSTGNGPSGLTVGDLNGDGRLDLAVANAVDNTVWAMLGNGNGTFQQGISFATGSSPVSIAVGDFNADGRLDLAVADQASGSASVLAQASATSLSATNLSFGNQQVGTTSNAQTLTLTNTGSASLNLSGITIGSDFAQTNSCGNSVTAGTSCTFNVTFDPATAGALNESLVITDNGPGSPQTVALSGTGTAPAVSLSPGSLTFANQLLGTSSSPQTVTLTNLGTATLSIKSVVASGDFGQTNTCGSSVAAGATCTISVTFAPTATGTRTGAITITDNASGGSQSVSLTGTGTAPAVGLSPTSLTFPSQLVGTSSSPQTIVLTNSGTGTLTISNISVTGTNNGDFSQSGTCKASLAAGKSCTINVTFTPKATGSRTAAVSMTDNAGGSPQKVSLSGQGTVMTASPGSLNFGSLKVGTTSTAQTVTITNTGTGSVSITSLTKTGADPKDFNITSSNCSALVAGASCQIILTFKPAATGSRTATLDVNDTGGGSPQTVGLSGVGT